MSKLLSGGCALLLCLAAGAGQACAVKQDYTAEFAKDAPIVVVGDVIGYERVFDNGRADRAIVSIAPAVTFRGETRPKWDVIYHHATFELPETAPWPEKMRVVAALEPVAGKEGQFHLMESPCAGQAYLFPVLSERGTELLKLNGIELPLN